MRPNPRLRRVQPVFGEKAMQDQIGWPPETPAERPQPSAAEERILAERERARARIVELQAELNALRIGRNRPTQTQYAL